MPFNFLLYKGKNNCALFNERSNSIVNLNKVHRAN